MKKWFRRIAVWALMLMLLCAATSTAFAYTTLKNSTTFTVNGKTIKASDVAWQDYDGCWYYALYMYQKIWGSDKSFSSTFGTSDNILKNLSNAERKVTVDNIKYFIGKAKLGAVIRVCGCTSSCSYWKNDGLQCGHEGHSMILVAKDADSLTVVDNWGSSVRTAKYTWKEFYNGFGAKGYTYFKYIKWPGASQITAYQPEVKVSNITITNPVTALMYGDAYQFFCEVSPSNAKDTSVTWTSSNEDVIWISSTYGDVFYEGKVGTTTITATANDGSGVKASCDVYIYPDIYIQDELSVASVGEWTTGYVYITSSPAYDGISIYGADGSESVAYVEAYDVSDVWGKGWYQVNLYGVSPGSAVLWIDVYYNNFSTCSSYGLIATVEDGTKVSSITITNPTSFLTYGDAYQFFCDVYPSDADNASVTWTSSNENVIWISSDGTVWYQGQFGTTTITATANDGSGVSASCDVTVVPDLTFDADLPTGKMGRTVQGTATVSSSPAYAYVNIYTTDPNIATISAVDNGYGTFDLSITGVSAGTTVMWIDVTYPNGDTYSSGYFVTIDEPRYVQSIDLYGLPAELQLGEVYDFYYVVSPADHDCDAFYYSYDTSILQMLGDQAYYDADGNLHIPIKAIGVGSTTLEVEADIGTCDGVNVTVVDSASKVQNITMSATSGLTAQPGGTVTVPVSITNPDNVALGLVSLRFALPTGVTVSDAAVCGVAADASVLTEGNPTIIVAADGGIQGSGQVVNVTFSVDATASFPLSISMHPVVCELSSEKEVYLDTFTTSIAEASSRIPGDVNDDGKVSYADLLRLAKYLANWDGITINDANADCNGDSKVSYADLLRLAKYLANWDIELK